MKRRWGERKKRQHGDARTLQSVWGTGPASPPPTVSQGTRRAKAQCALWVFHHCFQCVPREPKSPCGTLTRVFIPLFLSLFSRLGIISQALRVWSFASFLRNDYLPICYVKSYDTAHNIHILSNGSSWKILVSTRPGTFWVNVCHILLSRDE